MPDLGNALLLYSLRVGLISLESVQDSSECDYSDLKRLLKKHVITLESEPDWTNDRTWKADSACLAKPVLHPSRTKTDSDPVDSARGSTVPASTLISIAKTMFRTLECSSKLPVSSPALQKLREAVAEVARELEPAAKKEPKFAPRTGPDLYSRKAG